MGSSGRVSKSDLDSLLSAAVDQSPAGVGVADAAQLKLRYVNAAFSRLVGRDEAELLGTPLLDAIGRSARVDVLSALRRVAAGVSNVEHLDLTGAVGVEGVVLASVSAIKDQEGTVTHALTRLYQPQRTNAAASIDTGHLEALRELALAQALSASRVGSWAWDFATGLGTWDAELYRIFEKAPTSEVFSFDAFLQFVHPDDRESFMRKVQEAVEERGAFSIDFRGMLPDGTSRWFSSRGFIQKRDGVPVGMTGTIQDVDERRRVENALIESQTLLRSVVDNSPAPVFMKYRDGPYLYVNDAWLAATGRSRNEVLGHDDTELFSPETATEFRVNDELAMESKQTVHYQEVAWLADDQQHVFSVVKFPLIGSRGDVIGVCGISIDVTDRLEAERARLDERERIAMGIHDDAVQVMAAVGLRLEAFERFLKNPKQREKFEALRRTVTASIDRLRKMMVELQTPFPDESSLKVAVEQLLDELRRDQRVRVTLSYDLVEEPHESVSGLLYRILREALVNVGKHANASRVGVEISRVDGGVRLYIADDGVGFEDQESPEGHLGLSSMRSRALRVGGRWNLDSRPGGGTRVEVWLPEPVRDSLQDPHQPSS